MPDYDTRSTSTSSSTSSSRSNSTTTETGSNSANAAASSTPPRYTGIVHIGLNKYAHDEANALNRMNASDGGAKSIRQRGEDQDVIYRGGNRFDLTLDAGVTGFVGTLQLPESKVQEVTDLMKATGGKAKDEMAGIVEVYLQAEQGIRRMDRLVLSGHSVGSQIWGDDNGNIKFDMFEELARIFPNAASQVKHLMISACYAGGERNMGRFHRCFPSVESIWAYAGSSPGTWTGAIPHMELWEGATKDRDGSDVERDLAKGTRKADKVATWNIEDGYQGTKPFSITDLENDLQGEESMYQRYLQGDEEVTDSQSGPLRDYYNLVQRLIQHPEVDNARADQLEMRRDQCIRLLYYSLCATKFAEHYSSDLEEGYAEAGLPLPDFSTLSRREALAAIEALATAGGGSATGRALDLLQRGLRDMTNEVIPTNWV